MIGCAQTVPTKECLNLAITGVLKSDVILRVYGSKPFTEWIGIQSLAIVIEAICPDPARNSTPRIRIRCSAPAAMASEWDAGLDTLKRLK